MTILDPKALHSITHEAETAKAREQLEREKKHEEEQRQLHEAFMSREIHPQVNERVNTAIRHAAEQGKTEVQVIVFPATFCSDRGRRINNGEADWPGSLDGFARKAYEYYDKELRPLGYRIEARVLTFPDGMPGDVGLFLKW
jgi:hypothetical protein